MNWGTIADWLVALGTLALAVLAVFQDRIRAPRLELGPDQVSLSFDVISPPNHKGHIVPPGDYEVDVDIAAENASPIHHTIALTIRGPWYADEARMLRDGVGVQIK